MPILRPVVPRHFLLLLVVLIAFGATLATAQEHDHHDSEASHAPVGDAHEHDTALVASAAGTRLVVSDASSRALVVLDLASGDVLGRFDGPSAGGAVHALDGERYVLVTYRDADLVSVVRTGLRVVDHGDHQDLLQESPYVVATFGSGLAPVHVFARGNDVAVFNDGDGTVALLDQRLFGASLSYEAVTVTQPDHGAVVMLHDHLVVGYLRLGRVDVYSRSGGEPVASFEGCPGLHGQAVIGATALFGCQDGALMIEEQGGVFSATKIENPTGAVEGARVSTVAAHRDGSAFVGNLGSGLLLVSLDGDVRSVRLPAVPVDMAFADAERLLVLTDDGRLHRLDVSDGEITGSVPVVHAIEAGQTRPRLAVAPSGAYAYVTDPGHRSVEEVDVDHFEVERSVAVPVVPGSLVVAGSSGATIHDHGEGEEDGEGHDDDHDDGDDHDHDH